MHKSRLGTIVIDCQTADLDAGGTLLDGSPWSARRAVD
jgi:hypothetical protein